MRLFGWIAVLLFSIVMLVFALSNRSVVEADLFPFAGIIELPLFVLFFVTLIIGILLGGLVSLFYRLNGARHMRHKDMRIKSLINEVEALKAEKTLLPSDKQSLEPPNH